MNKCCRSCRNFKNGICYSNEFARHEDVELPEVYININKEAVIEDFKKEGFDIDNELLNEIIDLCKYHSDYEFEVECPTINVRPLIVNSSEFNCKDYR